jgi:hypothetical protein
MANQFKVNNLVLTKQSLLASGNVLFINGVEVYNGVSGNLILSGSNLYNYIIGGDTNLSGNLTSTGSNLYIWLTGVSGTASSAGGAPSSANYVYKSGDQTVSGNKTFNDTVIFSNNLRYNVSNVTGNFSFASGSYRYVWSGLYQWTGTLPSYTTYSGFEFIVKNLSLTTGLLISGLVDYANNTTIVIPLQSLNLWSNGYSWIAT